MGQEVSDVVVAVAVVDVVIVVSVTCLAPMRLFELAKTAGTRAKTIEAFIL